MNGNRVIWCKSFLMTSKMLILLYFISGFPFNVTLTLVFLPDSDMN